MIIANIDNMKHFIHPSLSRESNVTMCTNIYIGKGGKKGGIMVPPFFLVKSSSKNGTVRYFVKIPGTNQHLSLSYLNMSLLLS